MLARLQQLTTCVIIGASIFWVSIFLYFERPVLAVLGFVAVLSSHALVLAFEFAMMVSVSMTLPRPRPRLSRLISAWGKEALIGWRVFFWQQPFRSDAYPDLLIESAVGRRGVVLVHGLVCNRGVWNPWLADLRNRQVPFIAVNLEPVFGSLDDYPATVEAAVQRIVAATGRAPVVVAHSMGGLVVRAWRDRFDGSTRAHRIITVGTPHHGTWLARLTRTRNGKQMRQGSDWLTHLAKRENLTQYTGFTCFFSDCDSIVFPAATATLLGADNREVSGAAHLQMLFEGVVFNEVSRWLAEPSEASVADIDTERKLTQLPDD